MGPLGLHLGLNRGVLGGTPPVPPVPDLKIIFEGDSITSSSSPNSMANQWMAANPSIESVNLATPGAVINSGGTNHITHRIPQIVSDAAGFDPVLCLLIGANDLYSYASAADWQAALLTYFAAVRTAVPGIRIGVGTILPLSETILPARAGHNARRATVNPWMRTQVGSTIDFLIPYGDHPEFTDASADLALFYDGLHPAAGGYGFMLETLDAVLNPIVAGATGATPTAFTFSDNPTATASTQSTERNMITGMGMGESATASMTQDGDFARGTLPGGLSYGTGAQAVMNGDILTSRLASSATALATVQHTLAVGSVSDTWDITTAANPATTVYSATLKHASATLQTDRQCYGASAINAPQAVLADTGKATGKHYWEMTFYTPPVGGGAGIYHVAVAPPGLVTTNRPGAGNGAGNGGLSYRNTGVVYYNATTITSLSTFTISDSIGVCLDADNDKVWFLKNGVSISGDPVAGTGGFSLLPVSAADWRPCAVPQREDGHRLNCGQDPFNHTPPTGFTAYG